LTASPIKEELEEYYPTKKPLPLGSKKPAENKKGASTTTKVTKAPIPKKVRKHSPAKNLPVAAQKHSNVEESDDPKDDPLPKRMSPTPTNRSLRKATR